MSRILGILGGIALAGTVVWTVAAQAGPQSLPARITQAIPVVASVPVTLDDGTVQTVTVPLTVTLDVAVSVGGAVSIGAEASATPAEPIADTVTVENAADFLPTLADMPDGWRLEDEAAASSNEKIAASWTDPVAAEAALNKVGRLGGYFRDFRTAAFSLFGNSAIEVTLLVFETPEGAADAIDLYHQRDLDEVTAGKFSSLSPIKLATIGSKSDAYVLNTAATDTSGIGSDRTSLAFQKGNAVVFLTGYSFQNVGDINQLVKLAKHIEQRLP